MASGQRTGLALGPKAEMLGLPLERKVLEHQPQSSQCSAPLAHVWLRAASSMHLVHCAPRIPHSSCTVHLVYHVPRAPCASCTMRLVHRPFVLSPALLPAVSDPGARCWDAAGQDQHRGGSWWWGLCPDPISRRKQEEQSLDSVPGLSTPHPGCPHGPLGERSHPTSASQEHGCLSINNKELQAAICHRLYLYASR